MAPRIPAKPGVELATDAAESVLTRGRREGWPVSKLIAAGAIVPATGGVLVGGTFLANYVIKEGSLFDGANKLVEDINLVVGLGAARAESRTWREGLAATIENLATMLYEFTGGSGVLWFINKMRGLQHNLEPLVRTGQGNGLIEASKYEPSDTPPAIGRPVSELFNAQSFRTDFDGVIATNDVFRRIASPLMIHGPGPAHFPSEAVRLRATNETINTLEMGPLIDVLEQSTSNQRIRAGLSAIENGDTELKNAFDEVRKTQGIEGITALFSKLATGDQPAHVAVRAALNLAPN